MTKQLTPDQAGKLANRLFEVAQQPHATGCEILGFLVAEEIVEVVPELPPVCRECGRSASATFSYCADACNDCIRSPRKSELPNVASHIAGVERDQPRPG